MPTGHRSSVVRYGVAVASVLLALSLTLHVQPLLDPTVFSLFFAAVMVSAWYGGLGPGLVATALAVLVVDLTLLPSPETSALPLHRLLRFGVFVLVALLISSLTAARKRAEEALRKAHGELELRVHERTTELARATQELVVRNSELWRLQREMGRVEPLAALGRVTGTIAHELGTPLNSVLGYSQLLAREALSERGRESLKIIETQIQRMVDIIHQYLSHTRGSVRQYSHVDLNDMIRETLRLLEPMFRQHRVHVATQLAEDLPPLRAEGAALQRVFINLLNNAVDAMDNGGTVTLTTRVAPSSNGAHPKVIVEVIDTGSGIPPELLPRIFELFVTTKAAGKGTGLGLAVCQEIVQAHGGEIHLTNSVGQGTCVQLVLPTEINSRRVALSEDQP